MVTDRMLEVWPNMIQIVSFWDKLPKSKQPCCKSYLSIHDAVEDPLTVTKLTFFSFICVLLQPYLINFQSDKLMVPYLYTELKAIIKSLMELIVKPDLLDKCKNGAQLHRVDLTKEENLLPLKEINLGFGVTDKIKNLRKDDTASNAQIRAFVIDAQLKILGQMFERSPILSSFVRFATVIDPAVILTLDKRALQNRMKGLLNELLSAKILSAFDCEEALSEFSTFYGKEFKKYCSTFEDFKEKEHRLDDFWFQQVKVYNYEKLSFVVKLILTLSHGQASVELEFSVNNIVDKKT